MLVCCLPKRNYVCFRFTMSYEAKITELLLLPVEEPRSKSEPIMDLPCLMLDKATVKIIFAQYNSRNVLLYCLFRNILCGTLVHHIIALQYVGEDLGTAVEESLFIALDHNILCQVLSRWESRFLSSLVMCLCK